MLPKVEHRILTFVFFALTVPAFSVLAVGQENEDYPIPPEAQKQEGVPEGDIEGPFELSSDIFPGTSREYWIYVPSQYDKDKPACSMIVQDGLNRAKGWRLPQVFDNLIHANEMPVTIGIFVNPGVVGASRPGTQPRFNRSFEYDGLGDRYARFLLEELIPEVSKTYNLSSNPNDRALAGASSGGICAFNAAWERPDAFRRVLSTIGTYVGLRGGNQLSALVRKVEPKPLRIFLQDGSSDLNIYAGDWWTANQDMLSALTWSGYDVHHIWGKGGHNSKHSAAIMPEALRWLWRDYPEPIKAAPNAGDKRRVSLLLEGADWEEVSSGHEQAEAPTANVEGEVFFSDSNAGRVYRVGLDGKTRIFADQTGRISALAFGADGNLYGIKDSKQLVKFDGSGKQSLVRDGLDALGLVTLPLGMFVSSSEGPSLQWIEYGATEQAQPMVQHCPSEVQHMVPTADQAFLHLVGSSQMTQHARLAEGGSVVDLQDYGFLEVPYISSENGVGGCAIDQESRLYVASPLGIQVLDQLGRVNFIIRSPLRQRLTGVTFGSGARDYLFVTTNSSVFRRKVNARGFASFGQPVEPPRPRL